MKIEITNVFEKDLRKLSKSDAIKVIELLKSLENDTKDLSMCDTKKLIGYKNYYRIRLGDIRIGYQKFIDCLEFQRVAKRDEIYKIFP